MFMPLILLAVLFLLGFISTAHYVDVQRVRTWLYTPSSNSTNKVNPIEEQPRTLVESNQVGRVATESECNDPNRGPDGTELKRVFETFDKNGDGYITREELKEGMKGAGVEMEESEIEEMVEKMDVDGDGLIDLSEFCKSYEGGNGEEGEEVLREAFEVFDGNKDGVISVEELGMVLRSLGLKQGLKVKDCEEMIRKVDVDGDGMIDFGEFKKMMRSGGSLFGSSSSS